MQLSDSETLADAYIAGLTAVLADGEPVSGVMDPLSIGSSFGVDVRPTRELRPFGFRVLDPHACLLRCSPRQPDLGFVVGQWLWVMRGSDELEPIAFYNAAGRPFSEDGKRLDGAFGARMRKRTGDQLSSAIALLRRDPATRRALVLFADPADVSAANRDQPCAISLQLLMRAGRLEAITTMRSQSALMLLPYDAALFMTIHVWVAACLGVEPGPHVWLAHSFHIYEDELDLARRVVVAPVAAERLPHARDPEEALPRLLSFEERLRHATERSAQGAIDELAEEVTGVKELHEAARAVLLAHAARRLGDSDLWRRSMAMLPQGWPESMRSPASGLLVPGLDDTKT
jgi:hypothetical protein